MTITRFVFFEVPREDDCREFCGVALSGEKVIAIAQELLDEGWPDELAEIRLRRALERKAIACAG